MLSCALMILYAMEKPRKLSTQSTVDRDGLEENLLGFHSNIQGLIVKNWGVDELSIPVLGILQEFMLPGK